MNIARHNSGSLDYLKDALNETTQAFLGGMAYARSAGQLREAFPDAGIPSTGRIVVDTLKNTSSAAVGGAAGFAMHSVLKNIKMPPIA